MTTPKPTDSDEQIVEETVEISPPQPIDMCGYSYQEYAAYQFYHEHIKYDDSDDDITWE